MQSRAHDYLNYERKPLDAIFAPRTVAIIGATEKDNSVGRAIIFNMVTHPFGGTIYPVNPNYKSILGVKSYPTIGDVPDDVELAIIVTPARLVPEVMSECVDAGVKGAIVISAGFKETGRAGAVLEKEVLVEAQRGNVRVVGPNCLGVMRPSLNFNATFASGMALSGTVGFISQSSALCTSVLDWSRRENVGFSAFVSLGSMVDVGWGDLIYYLGDDPQTKSIVLYMETVGNARAFLSAAREVALTKPIIVIKPGRTRDDDYASTSHTGSLASEDAAMRAAFRRCGVLRVGDLEELFSMAEVLAKQPRPHGPRLTIVSNAGGPGMLATDALLEQGGELAPLSDDLLDELDELLPPHWSHGNPLDLLGDADADRYAKTLGVTRKNVESDGTLVIMTPLSPSDPAEVARSVVEQFGTSRKPVLASWMGGDSMAEAIGILNQSNIPTFDYPDTAARMFTYMHRYSQNLRSLYETPQTVIEEDEQAPRTVVSRMLDEIRDAGRSQLTEQEAKFVLAAYGIPVVNTYRAESPDDAAAIAAEIGYPVVLKLNSDSVLHKGEVGGVQLNLNSDAEVRRAFEQIDRQVTTRYGDSAFQGVTVQPMLDLSHSYELILGSTDNPRFGPVLLFGTGGTLVEAFEDHALGLPPLNTTLAGLMMQQTRIYRALARGGNGTEVDIPSLEEILVRFSQVVVEQRRIAEIEINPLIADRRQLLALDARILLHPPLTEDEDLPRLAIRPYPTQYVRPWTLRDGTEVNIRPIRPEDEPLMVRFHTRLSERSVYMRYFSALQLDQRIAHERLTRLCFIDYDREMALVSTMRNEQGQREIIGVGRLSRAPNRNEAEYSIVVIDEFQRSGLGTELLRRLIDIGAKEGLDQIVAYMLPTNTGMKRVSEKLGFTFSFEEGLLKAQLDLHTPAEPEPAGAGS